MQKAIAPLADVRDLPYGCQSCITILTWLRYFAVATAID